MKKDIGQRSLDLHEKNKGKLEIIPKVKLNTIEDLSLTYTPGVAEVSKAIARNKDLAYK